MDLEVGITQRGVHFNFWVNYTIKYPSFSLVSYSSWNRQIMLVKEIKMQTDTNV